MLFLSVLFSACIASSVFAYASPGKPTGYVNDYTGTLTKQTKVDLESLLARFSSKGNGEIVIVLIPTLMGDAIENYTIALAREWGIGMKGKDNGVLLFVAKDDHELRIEVGYGFEGVLTDAKSTRIIRDLIAPRFKEGDYDAGVSDGVREIVGLLDPTIEDGAQTVDYARESAVQGGSVNASSVFPLLIFGLILVRWIALILGASRSWWFGGVLGGGFGFFATWIHLFGITFPFGLVLVFVLSVAGLVFDYIVSVGYTNAVGNGTRPPWWTGGGSSGGSFGGFGGGSFGGGGSSGRW